MTILAKTGLYIVVFSLQAGAVVDLEFCPAAPHNLAVTSSVRVRGEGRR